jgi:hypothetical protein
MLHLRWTWDDHVLCWLLGLSLVVMVVMVVVHVTEIWVDEAVGLDLGGGLVVEMLLMLRLVHALEVTAVALGIGAVGVVVMTVFRLLMLFTFFLLEFLGFFWLFHSHHQFMIFFKWVFLIYHNIMERLLLDFEFWRCHDLWRA